MCQFVPVFMYVCYKPETSFLSSLLHHGHFLVFYQTPHLTIKCVNKSDLCHYCSKFMWLLSVTPTPSLGHGLFQHSCSVPVVCMEPGGKGMFDSLSLKESLRYFVCSSNWSRKKPSFQHKPYIPVIFFLLNLYNTLCNAFFKPGCFGMR